VMEFLPVAAFLAIGHFHLPSYDVFAIFYSQSNGDDRNSNSVLKKVRSTNVLIIPTYLEGCGYASVVNTDFYPTPYHAFEFFLIKRPVPSYRRIHMIFIHKSI
jgi:hypothetical protein